MKIQDITKAWQLFFLTARNFKLWQEKAILSHYQDLVQDIRWWVGHIQFHHENNSQNIQSLQKWQVSETTWSNHQETISLQLMVIRKISAEHLMNTLFKMKYKKGKCKRSSNITKQKIRQIVIWDSCRWQGAHKDMSSRELFKNYLTDIKLMKNQLFLAVRKQVLKDLLHNKDPLKVT